MRQREHTTITHPDRSTTDKYPEIDKFIPEALAMAKAQKPLKSEWGRVFSDAMNTILVREGLRIL